MKVNESVETALALLSSIWDIHTKHMDKKEIDNPFKNTGYKYDGECFSAHAYSWVEDEEQPWNFKWKDVEITWYKYLGRGMEINKEITTDKLIEMVNECGKEIEKRFPRN